VHSFPTARAMRTDGLNKKGRLEIFTLLMGLSGKGCRLDSPKSKHRPSSWVKRHCATHRD
jgi:hypothetical protein